MLTMLLSIDAASVDAIVDSVDAGVDGASVDQ
jgi:hypothetical protein